MEDNIDQIEKKEEEKVVVKKREKNYELLNVVEQNYLGIVKRDVEKKEDKEENGEEEEEKDNEEEWFIENQDGRGKLVIRDYEKNYEMSIKRKEK